MQRHHNHECAISDCSELTSYKGGLCKEHGEEVSIRSKTALMKNGPSAELLRDMHNYHGSKD